MSEYMVVWSAGQIIFKGEVANASLKALELAKTHGTNLLVRSCRTSDTFIINLLNQLV